MRSIAWLSDSLEQLTSAAREAALRPEGTTPVLKTDRIFIFIPCCHPDEAEAISTFVTLPELNVGYGTQSSSVRLY